MFAMAMCYHRKLAWMREGFALSFRPIPGARMVSVPCGHCIACRTNNAASWATRVYHESQYVECSCFVTLTYDPEHCPKDYCISKREVQLFLKRVRKHVGNGRCRAYFACGEYGSLKGRPHYHVLLLGWCPKDLVYHGRSYSGQPIYTSKIMERLWPNGFCPVGTCTHASAAYVARYSKKGTVKYPGSDRTPPFFLASRNILLSNNDQGALGAQWVLDHHQQLRHGYLTHPDMPDVRLRIPDYYYDLLARYFPTEYDALKEFRLDFAEQDHYGCYIVDDHGTASVYCPDPDKVEWNTLAEALSMHGNSPRAEVLAAYRRDVLRSEDEQTKRLLGLRRQLEGDTIPVFSKP